MKISDMILKLMQIRDQYGDLPIEGGYLSDDTPPTKVIVLDEEGCDAVDSGRPAVGVWME